MHIALVSSLRDAMALVTVELASGCKYNLLDNLSRVLLFSRTTDCIYLVSHSLRVTRKHGQDSKHRLVQFSALAVQTGLVKSLWFRAA